MRLDLYLKTSRLIKRRTVARDMCDRGMVLVNDQQSKPARDVKEGDIITLKFSSRVLVLKITGISAGAGKIPPDELYQLQFQTRIQKDNTW